MLAWIAILSTEAVPAAIEKISWITVLGVVGSVATVIFGLLSLYLYVKSKRSKSLVFAYYTDEVQTRRHPDVEILFHGEPINNLLSAKVILWNSGTEEIRWSDIPPGAPPLVSMGENSRILSVASRGESCKEIMADVMRASEQSFGFTFSYLNPGDGILAEVLYERSEACPLTINARIIGGSAVVKKYLRPEKRHIATWPATKMLYGAFVMLAVAVSLFRFIEGPIGQRLVGHGVAEPLIIGGAMILLQSLLGVYVAGPKLDAKLRLFVEDLVWKAGLRP